MSCIKSWDVDYTERNRLEFPTEFDRWLLPTSDLASSAFRQVFGWKKAFFDRFQSVFFDENKAISSSASILWGTLKNEKITFLNLLQAWVTFNHSHGWLGPSSLPLMPHFEIHHGSTVATVGRHSLNCWPKLAWESTFYSTNLH